MNDPDEAIPGTAQPTSAPVERLFPFVLRARALLVGRETLQRSKRHLHFVLITTDLSEKSRAEILAAFSHYPVVERFTSAEIQNFFGVKGAKVIGFKKSGLAQSIYRELKAHRVNQPVTPVKQRKGGAAEAPSGLKQKTAPN